MVLSSTTEVLFSPLRLGAIGLSHRVVMAPLTRSRALQPGAAPGPLMVEYYGQRASRGGLIVSEATAISPSAQGWYGAPGIYADAQAEGWRKVLAAVHAKGGRMVLQLWHTGRSSHVGTNGGVTPVTASVNPAYWADKAHLVSTPHGWTTPSPHRALEVPEIKGIVEQYRLAATLAKAVGFDGVEVHGGNGYLIDQFLQDGSNRRSDAYGGPAENRVRLALEVVEAVASVWGGDRTALRIAPAGTWNGMSDSDPRALFAHLAEKLNDFGLAYLHVIEPRVKGNIVVGEDNGPVASAHLREIFEGPILAAGGFEPETAEAAVRDGAADAVAFGRHFVSNPDLPDRIRRNLPLAPYDRDTFYTFDARGYTDYPSYTAAR